MSTDRANEDQAFKADTPVKKQPTPFDNPSSTSDIVLIVEDQKLHVSKAVLSIASPVFEAMFEGPFKEKSSSEIPLPEKSYDDMVDFLLCIYPSTQKHITKENLDAVLALADEYQVQSLKERIEEVIMVYQLKEGCPELTNDQLVHNLYLADKFRLKKVLEKCINIAKDRYLTKNGTSSRAFSYGQSVPVPSSIFNCPEFNMLGLETRYLILLKRIIATGN